jgi:hypothetical protein
MSFTLWNHNCHSLPPYQERDDLLSMLGNKNRTDPLVQEIQRLRKGKYYDNSNVLITLEFDI